MSLLSQLSGNVRKEPEFKLLKLMCNTFSCECRNFILIQNHFIFLAFFYWICYLNCGFSVVLVLNNRILVHGHPKNNDSKMCVCEEVCLVAYFLNKVRLHLNEAEQEVLPHTDGGAQRPPGAAPNRSMGGLVSNGTWSVYLIVCEWNRDVGRPCCSQQVVIRMLVRAELLLSPTLETTGLTEELGVT